MEAGSSNLPTPTTKPLVTGLHLQPGRGLLSFSTTVGAIVGDVARMGEAMSPSDTITEPVHVGSHLADERSPVGMRSRRP